MPPTVNMGIPGASRTAVAPGTASGKRVLLAEPRGYCAGVDRAVETVERALEKQLLGLEAQLKPKYTRANFVMPSGDSARAGQKIRGEADESVMPRRPPEARARDV